MAYIGIAKLNPYLKYGFLIGLLLITISSLKFEFIQNIEYLQNVINNLSAYIFPLTLLTITLGFLLFYLNREKIQEETEKEENEEKLLEEKRLQEFPQKFSGINKAPVLRNIIRWMYKEGWLYIVGFLFIIIIFFITRLYQNNFINAGDNYNVIAIKNMYENGISYYKYSKISDFLMLNIVKIFGFNFFTIKILFIFLFKLLSYFIFLKRIKLKYNSIIPTIKSKE